MCVCEYTCVITVYECMRRDIDIEITHKAVVAGKMNSTLSWITSIYVFTCVLKCEFNVKIKYDILFSRIYTNQR